MLDETRERTAARRRPRRGWGGLVVPTVAVPVVAVASLGVVAGPAAAQVGSPAGPVAPETLRARRAAAAGAMEEGLLVVGSEELRELEGDHPQDSDFRQDNYFFYLTGLETPGSWLVLPAGEPDAASLYLPPRDRRSERWTGPKLGPGPEARRRTGVADVRAAGSFEEDLTARLRELGGAPLRLHAGAARHGAIASRLSATAVAVEPPAPLLDRLRLVKDDEEIRRIRRAVAITGEAQAEGMRVAGPGVHEYEVEAAIEYVFRREGAERVGFPSIVGSGPNSVILHYDTNRRRMEDGDLVVVDIGAEYGYYTADVTRTYPVSGRFTPRQRALYDLVLGAQRAVIGAVRPGATIRELTGIARRHLDEHSEGLCGNASCSRFFVHGLSHWLGMDVHDVGGYGVALEPGMVLTVEPGVYLPEEGLGIRIEDDVLVTEGGHEVLSADVPRTADRIERVMAEDPVRVRR